MQFTCETQYDLNKLSVMAKVLRKTVKKTQSRIFRAFGWVLISVGLLAVLVSFALHIWDMMTFVSCAAILLLFVLLVFEDKLNGWIAKKQLMPGSDRAVTVFSEDGFVTTAQVGRTEWKYDSITVVAETEAYFVFAFGKNHAQLHDKQRLQGGTAEEFCRFLETMTGKTVQFIK